MRQNLFIYRPATAISIAIVIVIVGIIALLHLPVQQYPDIAPPMVNVTASYNGADAQTVMESVIVPLEESINGVEDMIYMTSNATNTGKATISVYFKQGVNPDVAAMNVQNRVQIAQGILPAEVTKVGVTTAKRKAANIQIVTVTSTDGQYDEKFIANWLDINLFPQIKRIEGVGDVNSQTENYSLRIWLKPDVMSQYGISPQDIQNALDQQNIVASAGYLGEGSKNTFQYTLKYNGRLKSTTEFGNIVVRATSDGNILRLKEVADIELGSLNYSKETFVNGHPGVNYTVQPMPNANTTEVNKRIVQLYEDVKPTMPPGMEIIMFLNTNEFLFVSMYGVIETLIIAVLLVILVIYFFLQDIRSTLIPTISIFVSIIGTFAVLYAFGISLNLLTLFAIVLSIGTVVDDSIVVVEAVQTNFENGIASPVESTAKAMREVTSAILSCTLVFMAVFIPVTFTGGTAGVFYQQFGITMATAVGISCVCALTVVPALSVLMLKPPKENGSGKVNIAVRRVYQKIFNPLCCVYTFAVAKFIRRSWLAWIALIVVVGVFAWFVTNTRTGLVPQEDKGLILVSVNMAPGNTLASTRETLLKVEEIISRQPEVDVISRVGGSGIGSDVGTSFGTFFVRLKDWSQREGKEHSVDAVISRLKSLTAQKVPDARLLFMQEGMIPGYGSGNAIELHIQNRTGDEIEKLYDITQEFISRLNAKEPIGGAFCSFAMEFPQYTVEVDAAKALRAGVKPDEIMKAMGAYYGGNYVSNFNSFGKIYRVMMQSAPEYRLDEQSLSRSYVKGLDGMAPLSQFTTLRPVNGPEFLTRFNLYSSIKISVMPKDGFSNSDAMTAIKDVADSYLPAGYSYEYGGMSREENGSGSKTAWIYLLCVVLIYFILVSLYESFMIPLAVILAIPFGLMGSFLFARIFGFENNIYLQIGVIMLIGLLGKTAILITQYAAERHRNGMGVVRSAVSAARLRFRPILMTVITMITGLIPLAISTGVGSVSNRSLGLGAVGGMLVGTFALLFTVPVFFIGFQRLHERFIIKHK